MKPDSDSVADRRDQIAELLTLAGFAVGIAFRFWRLDGPSLWMDEAYSRWFSDQSFTYLWTIVPRFETHPPFYYSALKFWRVIAGDSNIALRLPSAIAGVLLLPGIWLTARAFGRAMGLNAGRARLCAAIALGFVAVSPIMIDMARQARPYPFFQLAYLACLYASIRLYGEGEAKRLWIGYFLSLELLLWLHPIGVVFAFCLFAALAFTGLSAPRNRRWWGWFLGGHAVAGIAYLPVMLIAMHAASSWGRSSWLTLDPRGAMVAVAQIVAAPVVPALIALPLLSFAAWRAAKAARHGRPAGLVVGWHAAGPVLLSLIMSLLGPAVFLDRVLSPAVLPVGLLFGWFAASSPTRRQPLAALALIGAMGLSAALVFPKLNKEHWETIARWIAVRQHAGDEVWTYPNAAALPLLYAAERQGLTIRIRQIPADFPALAYEGEHPFGTLPVVRASPVQLRRIASSADKVPVVWLVTRMEDRFDPTGALAGALAARRQVAGNYAQGELGVRGYRRAPAAEVMP